MRVVRVEWCGRVEGDAGVEHSEVGASFGCRVARSRKGRGVRDSGSAHTVFGVVKEMLSGSVVRCRG